MPLKLLLDNQLNRQEIDLAEAMASRYNTNRKCDRS